ncbi:MAG: ABC transporter permease [Acetobacteraceae bacterium]|jgi:peptide/nickel transport system permease protein|nr:ABC transporter permease [Acetobacteraceae bacterium]
MAAEAIAAPPRRVSVLARALGHRGVLIGLLLFGAVVLAALSADWISPHDPVRNNFRYRLGAPNEVFWLGTDRFGRDILSRIIHGTRVSLRIGLMVVAATGVMGAMIGAIAGYFRRLDGPIMRVMDGLMAFPAILLAVSLAAALGPSEVNAAIALTVAYTPRTARIVRAAVLVVREMEYVEAARALGAGHAHILFRHILPNSLTPLVVQSTYIFALAILAEAVLSFIGVGPPPPTPSLGSVIADGRDYMLEAPWISLFPGLAIAVTVLGLNLLGDGLRDVLDPRMKVELR